MDPLLSEKLKLAWKKYPDAVFSLFTLAGHVVSGRISRIDGTVTLEAGKETAEVPFDRIEAISWRLL